MSDRNDDIELEISPGEVTALLKDPAAAADLELVDVREAWELARGVLPGAVHRPMSQFGSFEAEWSPHKRIVIYCEHGVRSLDVALWLLRGKGIKSQSMRGGFAEWRGPVAQVTGGES